MSYKRLDIILSLLLISLFFTHCKSSNDEFETHLSQYLEQVYDVSLSDLEGKNCLFYNEYSCSSCFEIDPDLSSELEIDFLFIVGDKSNWTSERRALVNDNTILAFDEKKEIFQYNIIIEKPLYFTYTDNQLKYILLEDKVYEKGALDF